VVGGDILWEMMVGCLEDGPKWCSILVSTTEVRTTLLFYIYGSWVSKRILILRDRIPNFCLINLGVRDENGIFSFKISCFEKGTRITK
jgi:hypothetical protein